MEAKKELKNGFGEFGVGSEFSLYPNNGVATVLDPFQDLKKWCLKIQGGRSKRIQIPFKKQLKHNLML